MEISELKTLVERMVQEGTVTAVAPGGRQLARVKLPSGVISDWLAVLGFPAPVEVDPAGTYTHTHPARVKPWVPKVNDRVLVLLLPCPDGGGYILGGL